ncbi:MAG: hypothetical protein GY822_01465 [Deltaproteobacteria bacterium]|nr:hypothetical protein [Deltaproteobacteria bacterium]
MPLKLRRFYLLWLFVGLGWASPEVNASSFDAAGRLAIDDAALGIPLDRYEDSKDNFPFFFYNLNNEQRSEADVTGYFFDDALGLEGDGFLRVQTDDTYLGFMLLSALPAQLDDRRVEMRIWQRPEGTLFSISIRYATFNGTVLSNIPFHPTGRVTSDGWREYSTGSFDFLLGSTRPSYMVMHDQQWDVQQNSKISDFKLEAATAFDAFEVLDLGPALVPNGDCSLASVTQDCGANGACFFGICADASILEGPPPLDDQARADFIGRVGFSFGEFEGGRIPQSRMANFQNTIDALIQENPSATFWPTLRTAIADLHDGHSAPPRMAAGDAISTGICLGLGNADLLPTGGVLPLVFSTLGAGPLASTLQEGDVLVSVDGLPPQQWMDLATAFLLHPGDPAGRDLLLTPKLLTAALRNGATVEFQRCSPTSPTQSCSVGEVQTFSFDLRELAQEVVQNSSSPVWFSDAPLCDHRFRRGVGGDTSARDFAGSATDGDNIVTLLINGVPGPRSVQGSSWHSTVTSTLAQEPSLLILDQRSGFGGTIKGVDAITSFLVDGSDFYAADLLTWWRDEPVTYVGKERSISCAAAAGWPTGCGGELRWPLGGYSTGVGQSSSTKVAVLNALDASGNDYTSKILKMRSGPTRFFGSGAAFGAYGVVWRLPAVYGEQVGGSFQVHDTLFLNAVDDENLDFQTSLGVQPDEIILQRQSDALLGVDTIDAAARAWLVMP